MPVDGLYLAAGPVLAYADALDRRDWELLASAFSPDVRAHYGDELHLHGRDKVIHMIRAVLALCGPTQHLLGNFELRDRNVSCYVRAYHASLAPVIGSTEEEAKRKYDEILEYADYEALATLFAARAPIGGIEPGMVISDILADPDAVVSRRR
jgi:hypothetical protein